MGHTSQEQTTTSFGVYLSSKGCHLRDVAEHGPLGANLHFHDAYLGAVESGKAIKLPIEAVRECLLAIGYSAIYLAPLVAMINERDVHDETVWEEWKLTLSTILKRGLLIEKPEVQSDDTEPILPEADYTQ